MLAITILTGNRPALLKRTLLSIEERCPTLVAESHAVVLVNGADPQTLKIVERTKWLKDVHVRQNEGQEIAPIGTAISELMARVPEHVEHVLHLEDDWEFLGTSNAFYERAKWILRRHPEVGQVRLRRHVSQSVVGQRTSRYHMVTKRLIHWRTNRASLGFDYEIGDAHLTFNPTLVRRPMLDTLFPCEGERDAASKFLSTRSMVAQLLPGEFRHIGDKDSLRERLGRET